MPGYLLRHWTACTLNERTYERQRRRWPRQMCGHETKNNNNIYRWLIKFMWDVRVVERWWTRAHATCGPLTPQKFQIDPGTCWSCSINRRLIYCQIYFVCFGISMICKLQFDFHQWATSLLYRIDCTMYRESTSYHMYNQTKMLCLFSDNDYIDKT